MKGRGILIVPLISLDNLESDISETWPSACPWPQFQATGALGVILFPDASVILEMVD